MTFLVLQVRPYSFEAEDGRTISGASVTYVDPSPTSTPDASPAKGVAPLTISVPPVVSTLFPSAPALYDLTFTQRSGKGGRPVLALTGAELVRPVNLADL